MAAQQGGKFVLATLVLSLAVIFIGATMMVYAKGTFAFGGGIVAFFGLMLLHAWYKMAVSKAISAVSTRSVR